MVQQLGIKQQKRYIFTARPKSQRLEFLLFSVERMENKKGPDRAKQWQFFIHFGLSAEMYNYPLCVLGVSAVNYCFRIDRLKDTGDQGHKESDR